MSLLAREVEARLVGGDFDAAVISDSELDAIGEELHELEQAISENAPADRAIRDFLNADSDSAAGKARKQYAAHVAYFCATKLLLVRLFEDLDLLETVLYDGGLDEWLTRLDDAVPDVVAQSFRRAEQRYPSFFDAVNAFTWFEPGRDTLIEVLYELSSTYLGGIQSDILGVVYERLLTRVDRKLLGQYYTPRDIIAFIWDLLDIDSLAEESDATGEATRVLDIATGSGGFLVTGARRLRERVESRIHQGANIDLGTWVRDTSAGFVGVEIQQFPAYLAEINLLIQLAIAAGEADWQLPIPPVGIICHDTLTAHNPTQLFTDDGETADDAEQLRDPFRRDLFEQLRDPAAHGSYFDPAVGNPPYVGERLAAQLIRQTRERHSYWNTYYAQRLDYLYWFLILGISKLRERGRFGFITTEYWLRATGARPLRRFLAQHCEIERLILFRDLRLFPDAPGQHSLIVTGIRLAAPGDRPVDADPVEGGRPGISIYKGPPATDRSLIIAAMREGRTANGVKSFTATVAPNELGDNSWADLTLTRDQLRLRTRLRDLGPAALDKIEEGVITGANRVRAQDLELLSGETVREITESDRKGVFELLPGEVAALGSLTAQENAVIRGVINTKDVYPYGAHLPSGHSSYIYLLKPNDLPGELTDAEAQEYGFPPDLPAIQRHLSRFRPILQQKVANYGERRPWWSLHRGRLGIAQHEGDRSQWADYAVTARWGSGGRLVVGLAPKGTVPGSALHALLPSEGAPAEYLVALLNSSLVQEFADTIPPGQLRKDDLSSLGIPRVDAPTVAEIGERSLALAGQVEALITDHGVRFPLLSDAVRSDLTLSSIPDDAWTTAPGSPSSWGRLDAVTWIDEIGGSLIRQEIRAIETQDTLLGGHLRLEARTGQTAYVDLNEPRTDLVEALRARLGGMAAESRTLQDVPGLDVPIDPAAFVAAYEKDRASLREAVDRYRSLRDEIDELIAQRL